MIKKILALLLSICCMSIDLLGCSQNQDAKVSRDDEKKLKVVTTIFAPYDFARQIAGDEIDLTMLLSPRAESHSYEPTPQDIIKIQECDEEHSDLDEHVWTSPLNSITISKEMTKFFAELDKENSAIYNANLKTYSAELENLDHAFT